MPLTSHIFISPHLDDAIACCGGIIASLAHDTNIVIFNVFSGVVSPPYAPLALELHETWGNPANVVALRRQEDQAAATHIGAKSVFTDIPEAIYRKDRHGNWLYGEDDQIFEQVRDMPLADSVTRLILDTFAKYSSPIFYAPLGIGQHVDHLIVNRTGKQLHNLGYQVLFYEDFPYVLEHEFTDQAHYTSRLSFFSTRNLQQKLEAFQCYESQIPMLFATEANMRKVFSEYANSFVAEQSKPAERLWILAKQPYKDDE